MYLEAFAYLCLSFYLSQKVVYWGSFSLTEALMRFNRAEAEEEKKRWAKTLLKITDTMNNMLTNSIDIRKCLTF